MCFIKKIPFICIEYVWTSSQKLKTQFIPGAETWGVSGVREMCFYYKLLCKISVLYYLMYLKYIEMKSLTFMGCVTLGKSLTSLSLLCKIR